MTTRERAHELLKPTSSDLCSNSEHCRECDAVTAYIDEVVARMDFDAAVYRVTVQQRDAAWVEVEVLQAKLAQAEDEIRDLLFAARLG